MDQVKIFVSYSWDSDDHKQWVRKIADDLEEFDEFHVTWDGYDLDALVDRHHFMESGISEADYLIVVATKEYKKKSDARMGGVGVETFLASAAHWKSLLEGGRTKVVVVAKDKDSVPNYLAGNIYLDFSDESAYQSSMGQLVSTIKGGARHPRPVKRKSISNDDALYSFTRVEDLIRVNYTNRKALIDSQKGTDFSAGNRIKYELWETRSPATGYILALASNINIAQTIEHLIASLGQLAIKPSDLTVLRPRPGRPEQTLIANLLDRAGYSTQVHEYTYKEYIWEFCIDASLKTVDPPATIPNYTDQGLQVALSNVENQIFPSALDHLEGILQTDSTASAHLVVAPGGMGKTSLCLSIASRFHNRGDLRSSVVLIQAEAVKKHVADQGVALPRIDNIYQLYELYAKFHNYEQLFDKTTFDLAVLCGNIVVIIDGLDEFTSLFQEKFNLDSFLSSLLTHHKQLGSSRVLLTTRNNLLIEDARLKDLDIPRYELLGFDEAACEKYLNRRFRGYDRSSALVQRVVAQIQGVSLNDDEGRTVPFFADIAATVTEDELREGKESGLDVKYDATPYPSNNELTDHIIHSVLRREEVRHGLDISVNEVVIFISGLVADYGKRWPASEMRERLELLYDARSENIFSKLSLSPLLISGSEYIELRYSFLASYFEVLFLIEGLLSSTLQREFIRSLSRLGPEGSEYREVKRYFRDKQDKLHACSKTFVGKARDLAVGRDAIGGHAEKESARKAIASLLSINYSMSVLSIQDLTASILDMYSTTVPGGATTTVDGLFISGDFPPLDFTNLTVINSKFYQYRRFLASRFNNTKFLYTVFDGCGNQLYTNVSLDRSMIDDSCDIGDLREVLELAKAGKQEEERMVYAEATKFFHSFFRGDRFIDNNRVHIKFSNKVPGLSEGNFNKLISNGFVTVKKRKEVDTFYEVADQLKPSVRRLLTNNYPDAAMKKFISFIRG